MIKNYIKIAWRNLSKNKGFTFIHLIGLSTGFAIALLIILYARFEMSYESYNPNASNIVRLTMDYLNGTAIETQDCEVYPPIAPELKKETPEVKTFSRAYGIGEPSIAIEVGDKQFLLKNAYAVDHDFLSMFHYPLLYGNTNEALLAPNQVVIPESIAMNFFNKKNVVGNSISLLHAGERTVLTIAGVCQDSPQNTHLKFDFLLSYPTLLSNPLLQKIHHEQPNNWDSNNTYCYVQLTSKTQYAKFVQSLEKFNQKLTDQKIITNERVVSQPIKDIHLYSQKSFEPETNGNGKSVFFLLGIALLVIISAIVNYVNLATSKALDRAKEVGIKKVVGSSKGQLKTQFLIEALLICGLSGMIAVGLVLLSKAQFIKLSGLPSNIALLQSTAFWVFLSIFIIIGAFLSGLYPAFVLSSFKPVQVLNGKFSQSKKGVVLRKSLVVFQFAITIILLIQTFTVKEQLAYLQNLDKGVEVAQTVVIEAPATNNSNESYTAFRDKLLTNSAIKNVALTHTVPGQPIGELSTTTGIHLKGKTTEHYYNFYLTFIDQSYMPLLDVEFLAGVNFDEGSLGKNTILVNEETLQRWEIQNPDEAIGKQASFWGRDWTIVGVVKNYRQQSPKAPYLPMIHIYSNKFRSLAAVKFSNTSSGNILENIKQDYAAIYPNAPFSFFFLDEEYAKQYKSEKRFQAVFTVLTGFSILIACLGLLGLASFSVLKRKKEIGIRKVVGASVLNILVLLSKDFIKTVIIAVLIGLPITYVIITKWLDNFANKIELHWWIFVLPVLFVFVLVLMAISIKTVQTAIANPVKSLKTE